MQDDASIFRLLISCIDRPGIVAAVSKFLYTNGANIYDASQHSTDPSEGLFFMRMVFKMPESTDYETLKAAFDHDVAARFKMDWQLSTAAYRKQMAIMVSQYDHCFMELLWRWKAGELPVEIPLVISNHEKLRISAETMNIPFHYIPVNKENKPAQENTIHQLFQASQIDFVVLARYMQILSPGFADKYHGKIINIHHSFLPAFAGASPYRQAYTKGVKLIGATAHYVTGELDEGPIIEQDITRVSHRESIEDMVRLGRDMERIVLTRSVKAHAEDRIIIHENKTIVF